MKTTKKEDLSKMKKKERMEAMSAVTVPWKRSVSSQEPNHTTSFRPVISSAS